MKLLRCPTGYIQATVVSSQYGELPIFIDCAFDETRGYTYVPDHIAAELISRGDYEELNSSDYPRDLKTLKSLVEEKLKSRGIKNEDITKQADESNERVRTALMTPSTSTPHFITRTTILKQSTSLLDECIICRLTKFVKKIAQKVRKTHA